MFLIVDSGSTKAQWAFVKNGNVKISVTEGLNPYFVDSNKVYKCVKDLVGNDTFDAIFYYGAGCNSEEKKEIIKKGLFDATQCTKIVVESDLLGAARAVYAHNAGWIGILGTGSNVAFYNGNELLKYTPSLGYILGDEGGGTHIAINFLKKLLYKQLPKEIMEDFNMTYNESIADILNNIYTKPLPNRYISKFVIFVKANINYPEIKNIVEKSFDELFKQHVIPFYSQQYSISFVGSVAYTFENELRHVAKINNIYIQSIVQSPLDGIVAYHLANLNV